MYFEVIFLVSLGNIYSEKCNNPLIIQQTKTEVDFLSNRLTALQGKLSSCKGEISICRVTCSRLRIKEAQFKQYDTPISPLEMYVEVIFLVLLGNIYSEDRVLRNSVDKCKYPSLIREIIKYSRVLANIGECYDSSTGVFTVKTPGIYSVSASMMSGVDKTAHLTLMKNGKILLWLYTGVSYDMASQTINVALLEGEKIWVKLERGSELHADYNVFTAVLIKTGQF
ncbi:unnamed protein product [Mytilus coruscus]|uniref:C1q domain-containing protein n=1 Tax=Mytilus coruscus TaxID=42192 RepID=A0A6J8ART4_MYTCO|nr:unnamed protein product [Mytilus coruscus]